MVTIISKKRYGCKERERLFNTTLSKAFIAVLHFTVTYAFSVMSITHMLKGM
jgi:hypothetical protein